MNTAKRLTALLLLLCTAALPLISCGGANDTPKTSDTSAQNSVSEETSAPETTSALDTIERKDFGGATFRIVSDTQDNRHTDFVAEEENGDTLNDLVFRRNSMVEEAFNITIEAEGKTNGEIVTNTQTNVTAGDNPYDLLMPNGSANSLAYGGYLLAWNDIDNIDLESEWWDQTAVSDMSIGGRNYMLTGDITPNGMLTSECILFNKQLFKNRGMEEPYDAAFNGAWTFDMFEELTKNLTEDLNGDGLLDDKNDMFCYTLWNDGGNALYFGMGGNLTVKNSEDIPELDYNSEKMVNTYTRIYNLITNNRANFSKTEHEQSFKVFAEGRAYFCGITFQKIGTFLRNMEQDFGILPIPKAEEAQEKYLTNVSGACTFAMIAKTTQDTDYAGTVISALAASAYDMITPTLFDVIAGTKNVRDEQSADIMQLIIRNRVFDPGMMYSLNGNMFVRDLLTNGSPDVVSFMTSNESAAQTKLESLLEAFAAVE